VTVVNDHQCVLTKPSEFFKRIMKPEWASMRTDAYTVDMSDDTVEDVAIYVRWLYFNNLLATTPFPEG
jgi:hypothetical protein